MEPTAIVPEALINSQKTPQVSQLSFMDAPVVATDPSEQCETSAVNVEETSRPEQLTLL